jgi:hypothetical protein
MRPAPAYPRLVRTVCGTAAALALFAGGTSCKVVDRPVRIDHAVTEPGRAAR